MPPSSNWARRLISNPRRFMIVLKTLSVLLVRSVNEARGSKFNMHFLEIGIAGARVIDPSPREDTRGRFMRAWCVREFMEHGLQFTPVQANMGFSLRKGTTRGMHYQEAPALETKLVRCTRGAIFDVMLDLRPESPSYCKWYGTELSAENGRMLYVPELCAHGYQTLDECTEMHYMTSAFYAPEGVRGVRFDDPAFEIQWPLAATVVSEQDWNWPLVERVGGAR